MEADTGISNRLKAGEEVEAGEITARLDELEMAFEDRGFLYVAVNGWLIPSLDADQDARELMFLRAVGELMEGKAEGRAKVVLEDREDRDEADLIGRLDGRYVPDGCLYSVTSRDAAPGKGM